MNCLKNLNVNRKSKWIGWMMIGNLMSNVGCHSASHDPFSWLEEVHSSRAIDWVKAQNERSMAVLKSDPRYKEAEAAARAIVLAKDRVPYPKELREGWVYNFWQDEKNVRGVWRRTTLESYKSTSPKWDVILDLDHLAQVESENWIWHGDYCLPPEYQKCLITLSRGGKDAAVVREFDFTKREFIPESKGGFALPEAKSVVTWKDENTLWVGTDFGSGSLTSSGYPRIVKLWKRGTPLSAAEQVFEGQESDVSVGGYTSFTPEGNFHFVQRSPSFFENEVYQWSNASTLQKLPFPLESDFVGMYKGQHIVKLRKTWNERGFHVDEGSVVAVNVKTPKDFTVETVLAPLSATQSVQSVIQTRNGLYAQILDNVNGKLVALSRRSQEGSHETLGGSWVSHVLSFPEHGSVNFITASVFESQFITEYQSFLTPATLYLSDDRLLQKPRALKQLPHRFDESSFTTEQNFAVSKDGTRIPYYVIHRKDLKRDGLNPTLLYGYGGFEISLTPSYASTIGKLWLEKGGVYVLANIRGGGEFGPHWHQAALKENRQKAFDDFAAVAQDLIHRQVTSPKHLGIMGGSNGGLLTGTTFTQHPELFNAVVCQVPLLDMMRYHKLLAGASWMAEYGNPEEPDMKEIIMKYSPYQNLSQDKSYPKVFFVTSTADDRVHPGHARKMAAKMESYDKPFLYFENIEGGHGAAANLEQKVQRTALEYVYLYQQLM